MSCETMWDKVLELAQQAPRPAPGQEVFLFGGGLYGTLTIPMLKDELNLIAICDNDKNKQGTNVEGLPIISPKELDQYKDPFVLISSCKYFQNIREELLAMDIPHCSVDAYVIRQNRAAFQAVYDQLDNESKRVYAGILYCHLLSDNTKIAEYCCDNQYFALPQFRYLSSNGTYIDCGVFTGDIVQKIVENTMGLFRNIYAFEPSAKAFAALQKRTAFLNGIWALEPGQIVCEQKGVGRENSFAAIQENGSNLANTSVSLSECGGKRVEIVSLDSYFAQKGIENVTFIKADIEGFEWDIDRKSVV